MALHTYAATGGLTFSGTYNIRRVAPHTLFLETFFISPSVYFFKDPLKGRVSRKTFPYEKIPTPDLPTYSVGNLQDWYKTFESPQYLLPLFLNFPDEIFSEFDSYYEVDATRVDRIDLISYENYHTVEYWWIILLANNILDPFDVKVGSILRIPSPSVVFTHWLANT